MNEGISDEIIPESKQGCPVFLVGKKANIYPLSATFQSIIEETI